MARMGEKLASLGHAVDLSDKVAVTAAVAPRGNPTTPTVDAKAQISPKVSSS